MSFIKNLAKRLLSGRLLERLRRRRLEQLRRKNAARSAREVFAAAYAENAWGGEAGAFYSGSGSDEPFIAPYCAMVRDFIVRHGIRSVLDVGCGDFRAGRLLQMEGVAYVGVDVVPALIERNRRLFGSETVSFCCLDAVEDPLPAADLVLVRQVLQHLSNAQIAKVLERLGAYPHVLVTEHLAAPGSAAAPNLDKPHGGDTRLPDDSCVRIDLPPFNVRGARSVLEVPVAPGVGAEGETIATFWYSPRDPGAGGA
jgi:SAM-dependent methyltransferase